MYFAYMYVVLKEWIYLPQKVGRQDNYLIL